jgi:hypothetical protein
MHLTGDLIKDVTPPAISGPVTALAYGGAAGGVANPDVAVVGTQTGQLFVRTQLGGGPAPYANFGLVQTFAGSVVRSISLDPSDWHTAYVVTSDAANAPHVWQVVVTDGGALASLAEITGNLASLASKLEAVVAFNPVPGVTTLAVGGLGAGTGTGLTGVFRAVGPIDGGATVWAPLGSGLPNADVHDLVYDAGTGVLVAGTFGRGAWALSNFIAPTPTTVGVYDPATATWYLRNSNSAGAPDIPPFAYGFTGTVPVAGDWDGDGTTAVGVYDPNTFTWYLRNEDSAGPPDAGQFQYGGAGWLPVAGDWRGSGQTGVGVFDPATATWYLRNEPDAGAPDAGQFRYGVAGGVPVVGDWTGTGHLGIGVFDPQTATWYLRSSASAGPPDVGVFQYGGAGWRPVAGDWAGAGHTGIGAFDPGTGTWYLRSEPAAGPPDAGQFAFGGAGWLPVVGAFAPQTQALLAAGGEGAGADPFSADQLQAAVAEALARLSAVGIDPALVGGLASARYAVGALPPGVLGEADVAARRVTLSADGAGRGWFADPTPLLDEEFAPGSPGSPLVALPDSLAAGQEDLLSAVLHEMGHLAGRPDGTSGLMAGALASGTRDLGALDQVFAQRAF